MPKLAGTWKSDVLGKVIAFQCKSANDLIISTYQVTPISSVLQQNPEKISDDELNKIQFISKNKININGDIYYREQFNLVLKPIPPGSALENCYVLIEYLISTLWLF